MIVLAVAVVLWLGPPLTTMQYANYVATSGFMDDVKFLHNGESLIIKQTTVTHYAFT